MIAIDQSETRFKMKKYLLILWFVCFHLQAAQSNNVCHAGVPVSSVLKFCQHKTLFRRIVYLDSSGFNSSVIGECACTLSGSSGTLNNISITTLATSQSGNFALVVDGTVVTTPVNVPYTSAMDIVLRKLSTDNIKQCLYVRGVPVVDRSPSPVVRVECKNLRNITSDPPIHTDTPTTKPTVSNPTSSVAPSVTPSTKRTDSSTVSTVAPSETAPTDSTVVPSETPTTEHSISISASTVSLADVDTNGSVGSDNGIIAGAAAGGVAVIIIIAVVVILVLRRIRKSSTNQDEPSIYSHSIEDPEYDMTINGGYVSADYVDHPRQDAQRPDEIYEDNADTAATFESFTATDHGASDYAVVNKSRSTKSDRPNNLEEETEYNSLTETILIRPTENMYGVALPIQPNYSDS